MEFYFKGFQNKIQKGIQNYKTQFTMANFLNNKDFREEIILSQKNGEPTKKALEMFIMMVNRIQWRLKYQDKDLKQDCRSAAYLRFLVYYKSYDATRSPNAFAYFTTLATMAMAEEFNRWQYEKNSFRNGTHLKFKKVSLDQFTEQNFF